MNTPPRPPQAKPSAAPAADAYPVPDDWHRRTLVALAQLEGLVARLEAGTVDAQARATAAEVLHHFSSSSLQHHVDEERYVFPVLAESPDPEMSQAVLQLRQDHAWLDEDWLEISPHLDAVACGQAAYDINVLREGVNAFAALSRDHIALEESYLYPQADTRMQPGQRREMGREMAARRRAERRTAGKAH
ncbi:MAG: hemerythrin domain-containing protein [Caldimonas sp.]